MIFKYDILQVIIYPDLKLRKMFVHDAWVIAKFTDDFDLKLAVSQDPYFCITREDIFQLMHTHDDIMIEHMLKIGVKLEIQEDTGFTIVSIKKAKVDQNLHT